MSDVNSSKSGRFSALYEPSGVQRLADDRLIVVEDEAHSPLHLLTLNAANGFDSKPVDSITLKGGSTGGARVVELDDLEGIALDRQQGYIYAITSHSRTASGRRQDGRERLIRFRLNGDAVVDLEIFDSFLDVVAQSHEVLEEAISKRDLDEEEAFNIEALSFDASGERLLIGLRTPVIRKKGVLIAILNPREIFGPDAVAPKLADEPVLLDLDRGGLRALAFDPVLQGLVMVSRREDKKGKAFKLWFWNGDPAVAPSRISINGVDSIDRAEGLTSFLQQGRERLLIVFDDGDAGRGVGAHYRVVDYADLAFTAKE